MYISIIVSVHIAYPTWLLVEYISVKRYLDIRQNKDYGTWRIIYSGVAITRRGLSTISSIIGRRFSNSKGHLELITVNCFFAKYSLGGSSQWTLLTLLVNIIQEHESYEWSFRIAF